MRWRTLIPVSLAAAVIVSLAISPPGRSTAQEPPKPHPACKMVAGGDCDTICQKECSDGSCCHVRHYNYPPTPK